MALLIVTDTAAHMAVGVALGRATPFVPLRAKVRARTGDDCGGVCGPVTILCSAYACRHATFARRCGRVRRPAAPAHRRGDAR